MIKIIDNDLWRNSQKIGWLERNRIFDENGRELGYYDEGRHEIYNMSGGPRVAYMENNLIRSIDGRSLQLDDIQEEVQGGAVSDLCRAAIWLLIGD